MLTLLIKRLIPPINWGEIWWSYFNSVLNFIIFWLDCDRNSIESWPLVTTPSAATISPNFDWNLTPTLTRLLLSLGTPSTIKFRPQSSRNPTVIQSDQEFVRIAIRFSSPKHPHRTWPSMENLIAHLPEPLEPKFGPDSGGRRTGKSGPCQLTINYQCEK